MSLRSVSAVLVRIVALAALAWATLTAVDRASGPVVGANIGAGLAAMAAVLLAAGAWGMVDGVRAKALAPVVVRWAAVAVLAAPTFTASSQLGAPAPFDWGLWAMESLTMGWFWAAIVAAPAAVGVALGTAFTSWRHGSTPPVAAR